MRDDVNALIDELCDDEFESTFRTTSHFPARAHRFGTREPGQLS